jgi:polysaccharide export outer membrane protein
MTVVEAVAVAGGLKDFANVKKMYILRRDEKGSTSRVRINYKDLLNGKSDETAMLKARDTVVVP